MSINKGKAMLNAIVYGATYLESPIRATDKGIARYPALGIDNEIVIANDSLLFFIPIKYEVM